MDVLDGFGHGVRAADAVRQTIYTPAQRPGKKVGQEGYQQNQHQRKLGMQRQYSR